MDAGEALWVINETGEPVVSSGVDDSGAGYHEIRAPRPGGKLIVAGRSTSGDGVLKINSRTGKELIYAGATDNGGLMSLSNKTGEKIVQLYADEYGNGVVDVLNRKGEGRTLTPGP